MWRYRSCGDRTGQDGRSGGMCAVAMEEDQRRLKFFQIYITVASDAKGQYALEKFGLPRNRIFNSRDGSFVDDLLRETKGEGVDIVLNSLSGKLLHASWKCVAEFGKMVELGKRDLVGFG